ncbi:MAG: hypothetical protein IPH88_05890 [Bacteroidales bacterium]|nr:hypothetical protein [Bacteroidales bacterium]
MYVPAPTVKFPVPEYGAVPPTADTVTVQFLQRMLPEVEEATSKAGSPTMVV